MDRKLKIKVFFMIFISSASMVACEETNSISVEELSGNWVLHPLGDNEDEYGSSSAIINISSDSGILSGEATSSLVDRNYQERHPDCGRRYLLTVNFNPANNDNSFRVKVSSSRVYSGECSLGQQDNESDETIIEVTPVGTVEDSLEGSWITKKTNKYGYSTECDLVLSKGKITFSGCDAEGNGTYTKNEIRFTLRSGDGFWLTR